MDLPFLGPATGLEKIYFYMAFTSGVLFAFRMVLSMIGFGDHDVDIHTDADMDLAHSDASGSDASFQFLSLHGLNSFFLMFGLAGLALLREAGVSDFWSIVGAFIAGSSMMVIVGLLTSFIKDLATSGNVSVRQAIGQTGRVYLTIPAGGGTGQVQVTVQDRLRTYDATSQEKNEIRTDEKIRVVGVMTASVLIVTNLE